VELDPVKKETFRLMGKMHVEGYTLEELAHENGTTPAALSSRFYKLKKELAPKIARMDDEKMRRFVFFTLPMSLLLVIAAVLAWLLLRPLPPPAPVHVRPVPTVIVAPAPTFDQAAPTQPAPTPVDATEEDLGAKNARLTPARKK